MSRANNILVTGAGGYVGSRLVPTLLEHGHAVRSAVLQPAAFLPDEQVVVDLTGDADEVEAMCEGADTIIHLAGVNEVIAARDPAVALTDTTLATLRVGEAAAAAGVTRLVYMSTIHVYGRQMREGAILSEDMRPEPTSAYAIARLASEHLLAGLTDRGLEVVILRLTNSVGAPVDPAIDRWTLVVNDLCRQGALEGHLVLRTSGVQSRDFIPLADVCEIVRAAARSNAGAILPSGTYNLGSGSMRTVRDVAGLVQDAFERHTGDRPNLEAPNPPATWPRPYHVSIDRLAEHELRASTALESAIDETVRFCLENRDRL